MRRTDREITDRQELLDVMARCDVCRLALNDESGYPYVVPLNFGMEERDGTLYLLFHGAMTGTKYDRMEQDPRATFEMDCGHQLMTAEQACSYSCAYRSIMGSGTIRELTEPQEKYEALNAIMRHMTGRNWEMPEPAVARVSVCAIRAERWTGKRSPAN